MAIFTRENAPYLVGGAALAAVLLLASRSSAQAAPEGLSGGGNGSSGGGSGGRVGSGSGSGSLNATPAPQLGQRQSSFSSDVSKALRDGGSDAIRAAQRQANFILRRASHEDGYLTGRFLLNLRDALRYAPSAPSPYGSGTIAEQLARELRLLDIHEGASEGGLNWSAAPGSEMERQIRSGSPPRARLVTRATLEAALRALDAAVVSGQRNSTQIYSEF